MLTPEENDALLPALLDTLDAIHRVDVRAWPGWGIFDGQGSGVAASWPAYLAAVREEGDPADFWGHWHDLFAESMPSTAISSTSWPGSRSGGASATSQPSTGSTPPQRAASSPITRNACCATNATLAS